jgi:hypothetical protein
MSEEADKNRYRIDRLHSKSLEGNPINSPTDRELHIYLPPGYFQSEKKRYPTIYFLHGYAQNSQKITVSPRLEDNKNLPLQLIPKQILQQIDLNRIPSYTWFDELISKGGLEPFIFVQPDGSLHLPQKGDVKDLTGVAETKGSFYINSPFTGKFEDYIVKDVLEHVDHNYRTLADKKHRALIGGSMGAYGALSICLHHPEKFVSAASLSPANMTTGLLDWKLIIPVYEKLLGRKMAEQLGKSSSSDLLETCDMIFSSNSPLLASIKRDNEGKIIDMDEKSSTNWQRHNLNRMIREDPEPLKTVHLLINCESTDEFGFSGETKKIHQTLVEIGIRHQFEIYTDPRAALSPHMLGIAYHIVPAIRFCQQHFT